MENFNNLSNNKTLSTSGANVCWKNILRCRYKDVVEKLSSYVRGQSMLFSFKTSPLKQQFDVGRIKISSTHSNLSNSWCEAYFLIAEPGNSKCLSCQISMHELFNLRKGLMEIPQCGHHLCFDCLMESIDNSYVDGALINEIVCPICKLKLLTFN